MRLIYVHGTTGLLVPPGNHHDLTRAISNLLDNPNLRQFYGNAAYSWVQSHFSTQAVTNQIYELYQSLTLSTFV
ncbi:MAG: glycosyltransferase [Aulosira sp. ZfuCHP01]|nr:glycosyltransferase [Aulosira sp. ZfuCHP01]